MGQAVKLWIFLPAALILLGLWITGIYLFFLPIWYRRKNPRGRAGGLARTHLSTITARPGAAHDYWHRVEVPLTVFAAPRLRPLRLLALVTAFVLPSEAGAQHALAQHGDYDASVPTPRSVLGYDVGARFTPHHLLHRYAEAVAAASPRVRLDTVAYSFEGREVLLAVVTSEANHARLEEIRRANLRLADPRGVADAELGSIVARNPSIVWLGHTVHGNEASGTEAAIALLYQLASGRDAETLMILDSTVVLIDPLQNPDGHARHVQDVMRLRGACHTCVNPETASVPAVPGAMVHSGNWPGNRTSHYFFDLNRDWFIHSHPETRGRVATFMHWAPHVAADLHEMGSNATYFFAPPVEPVHANVPASIREWWDIYAASNAAAFDAQGWSYYQRESWDQFYPGYGGSWPILTGAVGMTYEQASSAGGAIRRTDGTVLTLEQAARQHYTAAWATARETARRRTARSASFLQFRQSAIREAERSPVRAIVLERDADGRADSLVVRLAANGVEVHRLTAATDIRDAHAYGAERVARRFPAGTYVVDLAQPAGRMARTLLEPEAVLDSAFIWEELEARRMRQPSRFYDVTAWSLPLSFRVPAYTVRSRPRNLAPVAPATLAAGAGAARTPPGAAAWANARYGYAFAPGSEASMQMLARLLDDGVRVWHARRGFRIGGADFPHGALLVRVEPNGPDVHERVRRHAEFTGAVVAPLASALADEGTDLGSPSVTFVRAPRVALAGGEGVSSESFGFTWYTFDQRIGTAVTPIPLGSIGGPILDEFNVLVIPSASAGAIDGALGEAGRERLTQWVRNGGVLVTLGGATRWLASEPSGLSRYRNMAPNPEPTLNYGVQGAIVRAEPDTLSPLLAGVRDATVPVLLFTNNAFTPPANTSPGEVVLRYAAEPRLRLSGYMWPETPARFAGTPYLWTERVGRGRVIAFAGDPNFRDLLRGLLPIFGNAVLLGGSF